MSKSAARRHRMSVHALDRAAERASSRPEILEALTRGIVSRGHSGRTVYTSTRTGLRVIVAPDAAVIVTVTSSRVREALRITA